MTKIKVELPFYCLEKINLLTKIRIILKYEGENIYIFFAQETGRRGKSKSAFIFIVLGHPNNDVMLNHVMK